MTVRQWETFVLLWFSHKTGTTPSPPFRSGLSGSAHGQKTDSDKLRLRLNRWTIQSNRRTNVRGELRSASDARGALFPTALLAWFSSFTQFFARLFGRYDDRRQFAASFCRDALNLTRFFASSRNAEEKIKESACCSVTCSRAGAPPRFQLRKEDNNEDVQSQHSRRPHGSRVPN